MLSVLPSKFALFCGTCGTLLQALAWRSHPSSAVLALIFSMNSTVKSQPAVCELCCFWHSMDTHGPFAGHNSERCAGAVCDKHVAILYLGSVKEAGIEVSSHKARGCLLVGAGWQLGFRAQTLQHQAAAFEGSCKYDCIKRTKLLLCLLRLIKCTPR
jgi:hypothetical protein